MRLKTLHLKNFRALETMDIGFHPMTVIIGENDVGKTSCMLAIKTLFESKKLETDADLFMRDRSRSVVVEAQFDCPSPTPEQARFITQRGEICARCTYPFGQTRTIEFRCAVPKDQRFREIDKQKVDQVRKTLKELGVSGADEKPAKADAQERLQAWIKENLNPDEYEDEWLAVKDTDFAKLLPDFVFIPVNRDLETNLKMTETSLFGKLFRPLLKMALEGDEVGASLYDVRERLKDGVRGRVDELQVLLRAQLNNDSVVLTHEVDLDPIKGVIFDFGMDDERAKNIPIGNRGAGVHNNLILAMFRLLAQHGARNFILAIEEPENSLHPRGQREMLWALQRVAKTAQVICTTHSSIFLDLGRLEDNIVLTRTAKGNTIARSFKTENLASLRELLGIRVSDALLSGGGNCAMIVEGATELHAYPHFFKIAGHDPRGLGISIINAEGSDFDRIKRLLMVLNLYDIPSTVVLDNDASKCADDLRRFGLDGPLPVLRQVYLLKEGTFETYIPLDIAVYVMNERFEGQEVTVEDIDRSKDREKEFQRVLYEKKKPGARFEHFKVEFGELVGRRMCELKSELPGEIKTICDEVARLAAEV